MSAVGVYEYGEMRHLAVLLPRVHSDMAVRLLIRCLETAALLDMESVATGREIDVDPLVRNLDIAREGCHETVGHPVVIGTELHGVASVELQGQLVVMIPDIGRLHRKERMDHFVHAGTTRSVKQRGRTQHPAAEIHRQDTVGKDGSPLGNRAPGNLLPYPDLDLQAPVRGG